MYRTPNSTPDSPTSLRSRGQGQFIYTFLPQPTEAPFKDKTMAEQPNSKTDNTLDVVIDPSDTISTDLRSEHWHSLWF